MDLKQIEKLMSAMESAGIRRIVLKKEGFEIEIEREGQAGPYPSIPQVHHLASSIPAAHSSLSPKSTIDTPSESGAKSNDLFVTSPMVGTFYASPAPDDPPFIKVGDVIDETSVVCIIEAMKVMNEVKAQVKGVVVETLIRNGEPVEFGTPIFRVTPA